MPISLSGRIVTILTWLSFIIIVNSYTANLISHLTVDVAEPPIKSLKDFSEQSDWMFAMAPGHIRLNDWKISKNKYEKELYQRTTRKSRFIPFYYNNEESALASIKPNVLVYAGIGRFFNFIESKACRLVPLPDQPIPVTQFNHIVMAKRRNKLRESMDKGNDKTCSFWDPFKTKETMAQKLGCVRTMFNMWRQAHFFLGIHSPY